MSANAVLPCLMKTTAAMGDIAKEKWTIRTPNCLPVKHNQQHLSASSSSLPLRLEY